MSRSIVRVPSWSSWKYSASTRERCEIRVRAASSGIPFFVCIPNAWLEVDVGLVSPAWRNLSLDAPQCSAVILT